MGHRILRKTEINPVTVSIDIGALRIAKRAKPGQFIVLRIDEKGERIPLTIAEKDTAKGTVSIIFQIAGKTTLKLSTLEKGDEITDIIGPLGRPSEFGTVGKIVFVGGGVGIAEILPVVRYAKEKKNYVTSILGAREKGLLMLKEKIQALSDKTFFTTDDGSFGEKGLVTLPLERLLGKEEYGLCYAVGPDIMMKAVCDVTKKHNLKTLVSLDANMVDATGMCGTCRVTVGGEVKFTCVDGPEFDGHKIDWDEFLKRQKRFRDEESLSDKLYRESHSCQRQNTKSKTRRKG